MSVGLRSTGRRGRAGRLRSFGGAGMRVATACLATALAIPCSACPFCGAVGESLSQRRDRAAVLAIGESAAPAGRDRTGLPIQAMTVLRVLRGDAESPADTVVARVPGPIDGTALIFADADAEGDTPDAAPTMAWSAIAADESLIVHAVSAPPTTAPESDRLRWFASRLEHANPAIAADAFTEFGLAPYASVRAAADAFDDRTLARWIADPGVDQRRRGFYGLALGIVAATNDDPATRARALAAIRDAVAAPADDFRAGFDGLLAGLLVADGTRGLATLERQGLLAESARAVDQKHAVAALRFAWEHLAHTIPREAVATATARLLAAPVTAADAAIDLARYRHWDAIDDVAALWDTFGRDDPVVRRAVAGYLTACPLPAARRAIDEIRHRDAERLDQAIHAAALPLAR
ncbi:MAG: hypothetical protein ACKO35_06030 [Planctomycetaceae bacterium]